MSERMTRSFRSAVTVLENALTFGIHPSLDGIRALTAVLDRPQDSYACIQVTGTNGKSSVTRMIAALLRTHGMRVGCYTSPHLDSYTERLEVDGVPVDEESFAEAVTTVLGATLAAHEVGYIESPTEFELLTAAALVLFRSKGVDFAVLEVGMGGRWDATSVVDPTVAVITGVDIDHSAHLGETREAIAEDKAQIIKPACAPILGPGTVGVEDIFVTRAEEYDLQPRAVRPERQPTPAQEELTTRYSIDERSVGPDGIMNVSIRGAHGRYDAIAIPGPAYQAPNAATAIAATEAALGRALDPVAVRAAFAKFRVPARFEIVHRDPVVIADGSHNPQAARVLARSICAAWPEARPLLVLGVLADKDAAGIVAALADVAGSWAVVQPDSPRAMEADTLACVVRDTTGIEPVLLGPIEESIRHLAHVTDGPVVVTGSLVTAAAARRAFNVDGTHP